MEQRKGERQRDCASDNMADAGIGAYYRQPQITNAVERKLFFCFLQSSAPPVAQLVVPYFSAHRQN